MKKIDLSYENIMRTILMNKIPLKELKPKYEMIELIDSYEDGTGFRWYYGVHHIDKLVKEMGNRKVLSIHDYDDTHTTSVNLLRED